MNEKIEYELNKLIKKAKKHDEVPIAAIIEKNDKIISKAYNRVKRKNNIMYHAEIQAIKKASKKLHNWRLNDCNLFVTLEPCDMCKEIIKKSRINKVYYFTEQNENKTENNPNYIFINNKSYSIELKDFFKSKR